MHNLDDICYVGRTRAEGAHAEFGRGTCWSPGTPTMLYDYQTCSEDWMQA